jgi:hypothetical protein
VTELGPLEFRVRTSLDDDVNDEDDDGEGLESVEPAVASDKLADRPEESLRCSTPEELSYVNHHSDQL